MGIDVYLVDEMHRVVDDDGQIPDPQNRLHTLLPPMTDVSYQCLRFIDRYCDTVFNHNQMDQFLEEIERVARTITDQEQLALLNKLRKLAGRCKAEYHLYLKFIGD